MAFPVSDDADAAAVPYTEQPAVFVEMGAAPPDDSVPWFGFVGLGIAIASMVAGIALMVWLIALAYRHW